MSSETPGGGGSGVPVAGTSELSSLPIPTISRVRNFTDEVTIYEYATPTQSNPAMKPLTYEVEQILRGSPAKVSPHKLSPKILGSPSSLTLHQSPKRDSQSPCEQLPSFIHSPSSSPTVFCIPSKPGLTVTIVSPKKNENSEQEQIPLLAKETRPTTLEGIVENGTVEELSPDVTQSEEELVGRKKRRRRVFTPHLQKTMYRTRTVVKACLAAQNEKEQIAERKAKGEVPLVSAKPVVKEVGHVRSLGSELAFSRKRNQRKLSTADQLEDIRMHKYIDLETPGSILKLINLKNVLTRNNFSLLPRECQTKLLELLPDVDSISEVGSFDRPSDEAFDNIYYKKACDDWKAKLIAGEFTEKNKKDQRVEAEKDRAKVDPWKLKHFEPIWGLRRRSTSTKKEETAVLPSSSYPSSQKQTLQSDMPIVVTEVKEEKLISLDITSTSTQLETTPNSPEQILLSPGKRDSAHLTDEIPLLAKRLRIFPPIQVPLDSASASKIGELEVGEQLPIEMEEELAEIKEENLSTCGSVDQPTSLDVGNEASADNSSTQVSLPQEPLQEPSGVEQLEEFEPKEKTEVIQAISESICEATDIAEAIEVSTHDETMKDQIQEEKEAQMDDISEQIREKVSQEAEKVSLPTLDAIDLPSVQGINFGHPETSKISEQVEVQNTKAVNQTQQEVSGESGCVASIEVSDPEATPTSTALNTQPQNAVVSLPNVSTVPITPIVTSPIRMTSNIITMDSLSQPVLLRMVSLASNNPIPTSSVRMGPPRQPTATPPPAPTPLLPLMQMPKAVGGKLEVARNIVPKVVSEFIPVQPRAFLRLPEGGNTHGQSISTHLPKTTGGSALIGGVQSPSSPGNVSSLLNSKKNSRQKFRQTKSKGNTLPPPGNVNLDRSYQICNAVIQNSPNREQLQKQLVKPPPLTQNNRTDRFLRPELASSCEVAAPIQVNRRASTPTLIQTTGVPMPMLSNVAPAQKMMLVNQQGMAPLFRPIQQQPQQQPTMSMSHQIVVSSQNSSNNGVVGQRGLGMNVTFTTKHNPTTNSQSAPATFTSTPTLFTPQQLTLLLQHHQQNTQRPPAQTTQAPQQRPSIFISRPTQPQQHQQAQQVKIFNSSQFLNQSRVSSHQIVQFQETQRSAPQVPVENGQIPVRAQIMTQNGETLTIHRAGPQPVRINTSQIRSSFNSFPSESIKRGAPVSSAPPLTIINRTNFPNNVIQSMLANSQTNASPPPSSSATLLSPAPNLADFITNQLTASNIRPISPLAYETVPTEKIPHQQQKVSVASTTSKGFDTLHNPNHQSMSMPVTCSSSSPSQPLNQSQSIFTLTQGNQMFSSSNPQTQQLGLSDIMTEATILDLQDAFRENSPFSIGESTNQGASPDFIQLEAEQEPVVPPPLEPNTPTLPPTNQTFSLLPKRKMEEGILVQNPRMDMPLGGEGVRQPQYIIFQTAGSNGIPQNVVLPASMLIQQSQAKEEGNFTEVGPPRASSAPLPNQATMVMHQQQQQQQQQQQAINTASQQSQESKHLALQSTCFQDFQGIRVMYKDEGRRNDTSNGLEYSVTSAPSSYTLTPVSSAGGQGIVRVNLNGSTTGSARIIPGQPPVISIPDTTIGSSGTATGMSGDFEHLFNTIAATGNDGFKIENEDNRHMLIPVSITNNNRQHFQSHAHTQSVVLPSSQGNCVCDLRALMSCRKCGAYCHNDCMKNGSELCGSCMIR